MRRRAKDVETGRPLRRLEGRAYRRRTRDALARFGRHFLPLIPSFQRLAASFPSDHRGRRLESESFLQSHAMIITTS
jgi:hypothetical protein